MTVVIGLGNPLRADEGIGVRIVQGLEARPEEERRDVRLLDIGTAGLRLLDALSGADRAIIVDCTLMGEEPGTMLRFTREDVASRRDRASLGPHSGDLLHYVDLAASLGESPSEIVFFGIEPASLDYREELSPQLEARLPLYLERIAREIERMRA